MAYEYENWDAVKDPEKKEIGWLKLNFVSKLFIFV